MHLKLRFCTPLSLPPKINLFTRFLSLPFHACHIIAKLFNSKLISIRALTIFESFQEINSIFSSVEISRFKRIHVSDGWCCEYSEKFCITSKTNSREVKKKKGRAGRAMEEMEKNRWGCEIRVTFLLDFLPMFCVVYIILIYRTTDSTLQCVKSPKVPDKKQKISPVLLNPPCLTSPGLIETQTDCGEIIQINYESLIAFVIYADKHRDAVDRTRLTTGRGYLHSHYLYFELILFITLSKPTIP